jgi:hypothetical protein
MNPTTLAADELAVPQGFFIRCQRSVLVSPITYKKGSLPWTSKLRVAVAIKSVPRDLDAFLRTLGYDDYVEWIPNDNEREIHAHLVASN